MYFSKKLLPYRISILSRFNSDNGYTITEMNAPGILEDGLNVNVENPYLHQLLMGIPLQLQ
jgi:hypothetical protein